MRACKLRQSDTLGWSSLSRCCAGEAGHSGSANGHAAAASDAPAPAAPQPGTNAASLQSHRSCRLLLAGEGEAGQQAAAGALLRLFEDGQLYTLSLPSMLVAGAHSKPTCFASSPVMAGVSSAKNALLRLFEDGRLHALSLPSMLVAGAACVYLAAGFQSDCQPDGIRACCRDDGGLSALLPSESRVEGCVGILQ